MAKENKQNEPLREGCLAGPGERCWGMTAGSYCGPCEWCKEEAFLQDNTNPYEYNYSYSGNAKSFFPTEIESEGMKEVPPEFKSNW